jgi:hypothetical protein
LAIRDSDKGIRSAGQPQFFSEPFREKAGLIESALPLFFSRQRNSSDDCLICFEKFVKPAAARMKDQHISKGLKKLLAPAVFVSMNQCPHVVSAIISSRANSGECLGSGAGLARNEILKSGAAGQAESPPEYRNLPKAGLADIRAFKRSAAHGALPWKKQVEENLKHQLCYTIQELSMQYTRS